MNNTLKKKAARLDLLSRFEFTLDSKKDEILTTYEEDGLKPKERYNYKEQKYEKVLDEDGNQIMVTNWKERKRNEEELEDEEKIILEAIEDLRKEIYKMA